ncbi:protein of unknown function [Taphrina deformans PYCC 5710]|uniref:Pre-rRNA-processing protein RIX1 n=1 Tax=Taphrina deformans (strain PYCC 5710 / ATCC 11124 / CBS 356.35 / IMI 108563 / JCM 9778 / NBRC 8474) TaxID=1097556 RepID=R4XET6_TAPDE|nr:protein of unknown function [Taphrina deformans PYCC 5710]|eukprot:CCG84296.1 protein of unknown function [Taphrina deformans PYCC 5710]
MANRRLLKEYSTLQKAPNPHMLALEPVNEDDLFHWRATFSGQSDSPYADGVFIVDIVAPREYPIEPPSMRFLTKICHPNVNFTTGEICLDILKSQWSPAWTIQSACTAVRELLVSPEPDSPLNIDVANLLRAGDLLGYESLVRMYVDMPSEDSADRYSWNYPEDNMSTNLLDLEASMQRIIPVLETEGPFDGIMGFSQGAAVASAVASILSRDSSIRHPVMKFAILFCGARPASSIFDGIYHGISTPSLHLVGKQDVMVPLERSLELARAFELPIVRGRTMSQFHLKYLLNCLNDETNLVESLPILIPSVLGLSTSNKDEASYAKVYARLSALVQSKNVGIRWAGVCLIKGTLERDDGRWETLISHGSTWMKLLLRILERENSEPVIERTVSTIRTMIHMTEGKPSLTRDLTTPSLPTLFTHIFTILARENLSSDLIKNMLYHLQSTITTHSTTFRPFAGKLQAFTMKYLNGFSTDAELIDLAARCYATLHLCAPKNTAAEQWTTGFNAVLGECHATCSYIFQTVVEQKPLLPVPTGMDMLLFSSEYVSQVPLAVRRLEALATTLRAFLTLSTKDIVALPVGQLVMLLQRILELTPKSGIKASTPQSSQVALISVLPQLHTIALDLAYCAFEILGPNMSQHAVTLQSLILVDCSNVQEDCRIAALRALSIQMRICDVVDNDRETLSRIVRGCVYTFEAVVPSPKSSIANAQGTLSSGQAQRQRKRKHAGTNEGSDQISHESQFHSRPSDALLQASGDVLQALLSGTYGLISKGTRQSIDNAVLRLLTAHESGLDRFSTLLLLNLLKTSLFSAEPSAFAASLLAAGITTVSKYVGSPDPEIRDVATSIRDDIEVLIHPRFPAMRRTVRDLPEGFESMRTHGEDAGLEDDDDEVEEEEVVMVEDGMDVPATEVQVEPKRPVFETPDFPEAKPQRSFSPEAGTTATTETQYEAPMTIESPELATKKARIAKPSIFDHDSALDDGSDEDMDGMPEICTDSDTEDEEES